jgi:septal ring factor EnvC (AmiA/AmiB activator)
MKNFILYKQLPIFKQASLVMMVIALLFVNPLFSQDKKQLEAKRKKLQTEIKKINRLLSKTKKSEKNVLSQLDDINKKIDVHQEIITTIQKENKVYSKEITKNKKEIDSIEKVLNRLKKEYAATVVNSYKSKSKNSRLLFLLSSKDFLQAYKRLKYMNQFAEYRKKQAGEISVKKEKLLQLNDSILIKKKVKDSLVNIQIKEQKVVAIEKDKKQKILNKVKKKERKYLAQIRKKQKQEQAYEKKLENLIAKVIKKSYKKTGKKTSSSKKFYLTKEAKKLATSFTKNKGKLPAPIEKGYISRYFGQRRHEVNKKITIKSSGWFYTSPKKSKARAVFNGTVKAIMVDPKTKIKTVLIQHGNYMTVYGNLENLLVKDGDKVSTKQKLGTIHTDTTTGKTILKFQLWKDAKAQNPSAWMYK